MKKRTLSYVINSFIVLVATTMLVFSCGNKNPKKDTSTSNDNTTKNATNGDTSLVTLVSIDEDKATNRIEFRFYEKQAIFSLSQEDKLYMANKEVLYEALKSNIPIKLISSKSVISSISKATDSEVRAYNFGEGLNSEKRKMKGDAPLKIDVSKIDTSTFDLIERQSKFSAFRLCTNVVPSYTKLVEIFNYCASQGCNMPSPYTITNCIPFQYVRDGCYARAHKMRQMIISKYGFCCEKVFSFAENYPNALAVKANMWGGCCVQWWYHVVPLLRVNIKRGKFIGQVCYVVDPGMFTKPVTLSTWLNAQKNTTCNPNATVTSYSIQPGTAYTPMGSSSSFSTDIGYVYTEQTLVNYKLLTTCP